MVRTKPKKIIYSDNFQKNYYYTLTESEGKNFHPEFRPHLTPRQMLQLGVFGGAYFVGVKNLIPSDLPKSWFEGVKLSSDGEKHGGLNYFGLSASQPLKIWQNKGWIYHDDPHGWFQWYCRYHMGRRIPEEDDRQIKRWKAIKRHIAQIEKNCKKGDQTCRPKQRQAVLHWGYDGRRL